MFASVSYAAEMNDLYRSQAPVSSREANVRDDLTPLLLQKVLLKVVGDRNALATVDLSSIAANSQQYVQQFSYQRINTANADITQPDQLALTIDFNQNSVDNLIKQLGLPIWGKVRPDVVVWLAYQSSDGAQLMGLENAPAELIKTLTNVAKNRGIPLMIPLMDLQDQSQLTFQDIWQGNEALAKSASVRYGADVVLIARISNDNGATQIRWQTDINGEQARWFSEGRLAQAVDEGIAELTDRLAGNYTQVLTQNVAADSLMMSVSNVLNFADYSRLMAYLHRVDTITDIRVVSLSGEQLDLDISFKGNKQILQKTLLLGQMLIDENLPDSTGFSHYRLAP